MAKYIIQTAHRRLSVLHVVQGISRTTKISARSPGVLGVVRTWEIRSLDKARQEAERLIRKLERLESIAKGASR